MAQVSARHNRKLLLLLGAKFESRIEIPVLDGRDWQCHSLAGIGYNKRQVYADHDHTRDDFF